MIHYYTDTHKHIFMCGMEFVMEEKASERNMVNITLTVSKEERKALKQIALDNDITVSALLRLWLKEYQEKDGVKA